MVWLKRHEQLRLGHTALVGAMDALLALQQGTATNQTRPNLPQKQSIQLHTYDALRPKTTTLCANGADTIFTRICRFGRALGRDGTSILPASYVSRQHSPLCQTR